jgi:hypothetical protein
VHGHNVVINVNNDKHGRLALFYPFEFFFVFGIVRRQWRKIVGEFQQKLEP